MHFSKKPVMEPHAQRNPGVSATPLSVTLLLCESIPCSEHYKLRELLDFFGMNWKSVATAQMAVGGAFSDRGEYGILSSAADMAQALQAVVASHGDLPPWVMQASSVYIFGFEHSDRSQELLRFLTGDVQATIRDLNRSQAALLISSDFPEFCGPMSGLEVLADVSNGGRCFGINPRNEGFWSIISSAEGQVFVRVICQGVPFYLDVSSELVDLTCSSDKPFDVKKHFCGAVPVALYLRWIHNRCRKSTETSACLIVDDPPLKIRYGFLDLREMIQLMDHYCFTTSIAFIPWNWRRTDQSAVELLRSRPNSFSIAVHGCDHTANEFATQSAVLLDKRIKTARQRMDSLVSRTSLPYDRIMVFPQGAFSSAIGRALKLNEFVAAVNTEVAPWGGDGNETKIRDLWEVAIMKYDSFPIFTRRYLSSGIENFAFDAILGKPCLIAAHHDVFKGHGRDLADFVAKLNSLNWNLCWRPLGAAVEHSFGVRAQANETLIRMFSENLVIENPTGELQEAVFMKQESDAECVHSVMLNETAIEFTCHRGHLWFRARLLPQRTARIVVKYFEDQNVHASGADGSSIGYQVKTRLRRHLSEFRDNYICRSEFLNTNATKIRQRLKA